MVFGIRSGVSTDTDALVKSFESVPLLYIADGHHRAASASRARAELKQQSFAHTGQEDYNYFLTVIFPDSQVQILAYNRTVHDLNGLSKEEFLDAGQGPIHDHRKCES